MRALIWATSLLLLTAAFSCKHEVEKYTSEALSDYLPLVVGKFIVYQLDSTVFTGPGRSQVRHHYQEKQEVAAELTDNLGQPSFRINRYLRDSAGTENWRVAGTFMITPLENRVEVVENNLRTVRLVLPLQKDYTWKGNEYLPFKPYGDLYNFSSDINYNPKFWDFFYENVGETLSLNGNMLENVITVKSIDFEESADGNASYTEKTYSEDKYAKGIGLVYQELVMQELDANTGGSNPFYVGFGVTRTLLEHN